MVAGFFRVEMAGNCINCLNHTNLVILSQKEVHPMIMKLPWKNIIIVFTAMLVVPVIAFAITTTANPDDAAKDTNSNIQITSDQSALDAASSATSVLTAGALGYLDAATSATGSESKQSRRRH
jgi:hypothetical protein